MISIVILAAGSGSRIGETKQVLPLGAKPILQHVIDTATDAKVDEILAQVASAAQADFFGVLLGKDPQEAARQMTNLPETMLAILPGEESGKRVPKVVKLAVPKPARHEVGELPVKPAGFDEIADDNRV